MRGPGDNGHGSQVAPPAVVLHGTERLPVGPDGIAIGRRSDNTLVLATDRVSRHHARIGVRGAGYWIEDLDSMNGTYVNGERFCGDGCSLSSGDTISIGGESLRFVTGDATAYGTSSGTPLREEHVEFRGGRLTLGRDPANDVVLRDPNVSRFHAEIVEAAGGPEVRDLGSSNGTRVDGRLVDRAAVRSGAEIRIGAYRLVFDGSTLVARDDRGALRLDADRVTVTRGERTILSGASLSVEPGELVALIGESGSGKTTFLKTLAGVSEPSSGLITVGGEPVASRLTDIGYVPQDEIVHGQLTVREALRYSARLRLPGDSSRPDVDAAVDRVLAEVSLEEHADQRVSALSGGQRKRAGVAVELLGRPSLLFLDEPTTGLDPELESRVMSLLRELADGSRAVTVVTHATKNLHLCDRIVVMGRGGQIVFSGRPSEALEFFAVDSFDGIYTALLERPTDEWRALYEAKHPPVALDGRAAFPGHSLHRARRPALPQLGVLSARYLKLMSRDRRNLLILFGQVPLLAFAAAGMFKHQIFGHHSGLAGNSATLLFLLVTTALWLGSIDSAREIVKERSVYRREAAVGVRLSAYLGSKVAVLFPLAALQTCLLAGIVFGLRPLHEAPRVYAEVVGLLVLTAMVAVSMGLLISALVRSQDQATSFIPLALIPQLFFAGAIVPVARMGEPIGTLSAAAFGQWSFAGVGTAVGMNGRIASDPQFAKTSTYGTGFFDVGFLPACAILTAFLIVMLALAATRVRRPDRA